MKKTLAELVAPLNALAALQGIKVDPKDFVGLPVFKSDADEKAEIETLRMKAFNFG